MSFFQIPPTLGNQYLDDFMLRSYLERTLPQEMLEAIRPELLAMGELSGGELFELQQRDRLNEPELTQWSPWGERIDHIEVSPLWQRAARIAAERGLIAIPYERKHGALSRVHQFALVYLFEPSSDVYTCPLAMTDGAAKTLVVHKNQELIDRALPKLTSRDPDIAWTSGQWMTERTGGSDVAISETIAKKEGDAYRLYGTKWFTSATTSQMALTLARPVGNPPGGRGLALFYVEQRDQEGKLNGIVVNRLKDKMGTRKVPTAELLLDGAAALPVIGLSDGIRNIAPMLNITRTWNAVGAIGGMRRAIALARDYAKKRIAFGSPLSEKPLHIDTLASLEAEYQGAFLLAFRVVELLGREEATVLTEGEANLARLLTPIAKLLTGRQAVHVASEAVEAFGGAGYIEDTGLPRLLRDAQVLSIWEGTTNVLSLDVLRALSRGADMASFEAEISRLLARADAAGLSDQAKAVRAALVHAARWFEGAAGRGRDSMEAGARRFAMTLGRAMQLALLIDHGAWLLQAKGDARGVASARRFARHGVDLIVDEEELREAYALANGEGVEPVN